MDQEQPTGIGPKSIYKGQDRFKRDQVHGDMSTASIPWPESGNLEETSVTSVPDRLIVNREIVALEKRGEFIERKRGKEKSETPPNGPDKEIRQTWG